MIAPSRRYLHSPMQFYEEKNITVVEKSCRNVCKKNKKTKQNAGKLCKLP